MKPIRIQKIRDSARGENCTVQSPWCNNNPETVVLCHWAEPGEKGLGTKPDDTSAFYGCSDCHDWIDGRVNHGKQRLMIPDKPWYVFRAMRRTWALLIRSGVLK